MIFVIKMINCFHTLINHLHQINHVNHSAELLMLVFIMENPSEL